MATDCPKESPEVWLTSVSLADSVRLPAQPSPGIVNTYAAPALLIPPGLALGAPTTTVSPLMATESPNVSPSEPSEAVSLAVKVDVVAQPAPGLTNT